MKFTNKIIVLFFLFLTGVVWSQDVPKTLYPTDKDVKWITDPTSKPIAEPAMKWGDATKRFSKDDTPIPYSKDPTVVKFKGRYLMYFSLPPSDKVKTPYGWIIGIAESSDLTNWKTVTELPPMQQCDAKGLCAPCARVWDDKVHLFYQTYGNGKNDAICYASSEDGIKFTPHPENPVFRPHGNWTCGRAIDADVFEFKGKLFLYAATRDPDMRIQKLVVATADKNSDYGPNTWTQAVDRSILEPQLPWETRCIEASTVCRRNNALIMFYAGGYNNDPQQIGVARSEDGINWTRLWSVPFIPNGLNDQWNSSESGHPGVFEDNDGRTYLFYQGNPDRGKSWYLSVVEIGWKDNDVPFVIEK
ncbi:MAG: family 43 glycosylhydrolase [Planctomycetaceae bacterium]|nr:family 43 glycosylhydrolase [Planctomycetaceae bacterium]